MIYVATHLAVGGVVMTTIGSVSAAVGIVLLSIGEGLIAIATDDLNGRMAKYVCTVMNNCDMLDKAPRLMLEIWPVLNFLGAAMRIWYCILAIIIILMGIMFGMFGLLYTAVGTLLFDQRTVFFDQRTR